MIIGPSLLTGLSVCFFSCHPAPANQFIDLSTIAKEAGATCVYIAGGESSYKILSPHSKDTHFFSIDSELDLTASKIADLISTCDILITDLPNPFTQLVVSNLKGRASAVKLVGYYDNPETFVPGGYSKQVGKVVQYLDAIFFRNGLHEAMPIFSELGCAMDLDAVKKVGIYYSSIPKEVERMKVQRQDRFLQRKRFFEHQKLSDRGQQLVLISGGANSVFYHETIPHFLHLLEESIKSGLLPDSTIVYQQHGRAKTEDGNPDGKQILAWKASFLDPFSGPKPEFVFSHLPFNDAVVLSDFILYHQTSDNAKFYLLGIPTLQVSKEPYPDLLIRNGLIECASTPEILTHVWNQAKKDPSPKIHKDVVYKEMGYSPDFSVIFTYSLKGLFE